MPNLRRTRDGAGDSGPMSLLLRRNPETNKIEEKSGPPEVGYSLRVGSLHARSYSAQDWWQTTIITDIISDAVEETDFGSLRVIKFRTGNSEYEWSEYT